MARPYADENVPLPVVEELRRLGHDVLTIFEDGKANRRYPDASVLQDAGAHGRVVVTLNRKHFRRLHKEGSDGEDLVVRFAVKREEIFNNAGSRLSLSMDGKAIEIEGVALHVIPGCHVFQPAGSRRIKAKSTRLIEQGDPPIHE